MMKIIACALLIQEGACYCKECSELSDRELADIRNGLMGVMSQAAALVDSPQSLSQAAATLAKLTNPRGVLNPHSLVPTFLSISAYRIRFIKLQLTSS